MQGLLAAVKQVKVLDTQYRVFLHNFIVYHRFDALTVGDGFKSVHKNTNAASLELATLKSLSQSSTQPNRGNVQQGYDGQKKQSGRKHHGLGCFTILALKTERVDLESEMHERS